MQSTLHAKAQITLPMKLRRLLGLDPGDRVTFVVQADGQITMHQCLSPSFSQLRGVLPKPLRAVSIKNMNEATAFGRKPGHGC